MLFPDYNSFRRMARGGNMVPVCEVFRADLLTPVGAYLRLARKARYACLLESVEGAEKIARYTFLGADPIEVFRYRAGVCTLESGGRTHSERARPIEYLRRLVGRYHPVRLTELPPLVGGAIGYFGYEMVRLIEQVPLPAGDGLAMDDAVMMLYPGLVVFDHVKHRVWAVRYVFTEGGRSLRRLYDAAARQARQTRRRLEQPLRQRPGVRHATGAPRLDRRFPVEFGASAGTAGLAYSADGRLPKVYSNMPKSEYLESVRESKRLIRAGDIFQVVPSQRFVAASAADPFDIYRALRVVNPSPYLYFLKLGDTAIAGSSPEMLVKIDGRDASYRPIAGTRRRGRDDAEDRRLAAEMQADPKERAEHIMLVDLGRNDLGRVCEYGSVKVEEMMCVERYSHVMHLVSRLKGRLRRGVDCLDALMACFPAGTLTGAPKVRAMEIISALEPTRRGVYSGAILYLDFSGNLDSCIAIRTLVIKNGRAYFQAGAGIVADSVPEREYAETLNKARALVAALGIAGHPDSPERR
ncbi:MAG TPA: anthranilate synthase component I [Candidatus Acidoferrales bacterium]|nr:anthranilate synthase component I [Candidatus Acidoferrales bacterium]